MHDWQLLRTIGMTTCIVLSICPRMLVARERSGNVMILGVAKKIV